jgi:hypothetical protein
MSRPCSGFGAPPNAARSNPTISKRLVRRAFKHVGFLYETLGGFDPAGLRNDACLQEQQPGTASARRCDFQPRTKRLCRGHESATGNLGNLGSRIVRTSIGDDNPRQKTSCCGGNQGGQRRHQGPLRLVRCNNGTQHGTAAVRHRWHNIMWNRASVPRDRVLNDQIVGGGAG